MGHISYLPVSSSLNRIVMSWHHSQKQISHVCAYQDVTVTMTATSPPTRNVYWLLLTDARLVPAVLCRVSCATAPGHVFYCYVMSITPIMLWRCLVRIWNIALTGKLSVLLCRARSLSQYDTSTGGTIMRALSLRITAKKCLVFRLVMMMFQSFVSCSPGE